MPDPKPAQDEVYEAVSAAYDQVESLYDASEGTDSVTFFKALVEISKLRTALNQSHLESRTGEYEAMKEAIGGIIGEIQNAQKSINNVIKVAATATKIAGYLDKAANLAAKYFA